MRQCNYIRYHKLMLKKSKNRDLFAKNVSKLPYQGKASRCFAPPPVINGGPQKQFSPTNYIKAIRLSTLSRLYVRISLPQSLM